MHYVQVTYNFGDTFRSASFQLHIQWFSNVTAHATWNVSNLLLLLRCALIAFVSRALMLGHSIAMQMDIVRKVQL